ncbi:PH domain-containing protein [Leuconostoc suionicum]|uniref:PH domain-containing protein n=1 Tax=Leuconostoc suionicum TaxID=1511761 RepID=UPI0021A5E623|nr:PH domain-containing protein [Leuconostoc suionicum]MCT4376187.1 hypothetical protein [Leuconostoc suionicum]
MIKQHQSLFAVFINLLTNIKLIVWPILLGLFNMNGSRFTYFPIIVIVTLLLLLLSAWVQWFFFIFEFDEHELTVKKGIINKNQLHIPFERIQTITRTIPFYYQPFHVVRMQIDTSGQGKPDVIFDALTIKQANLIEQKRRVAQNSIKKESETVETTKIQYQVTTKELIVYALTSLGGLGGVVVLFTLWSQVDEMLPKNLKSSFEAFFNHQSVTGFCILFVSTVIVGIFVGFFRIFNRYFNFKIKHQNNHLEISRGFLAHKTMQLKLNRIQTIQLRQTILRRLVRLVSVNVLLSASQDEKDAQTVLIPVASIDKIMTTLKKVLTSIDFDVDHWQVSNIDKAAWYQVRFSVLRNIFIMVFVISVVIFYFPSMLQRSYILLFFFILIVIIAILILKNILTITDQKLGFNQELVYIQRSNGFSREGYYIRRDKIQGVRERGFITLFRKKALHLDIIVRDGNGHHIIHLRYVPQSTVNHFKQWLNIGL